MIENEMSRTLIYFALKYKGKWDEISNAINKYERPAKEDIEKAINEMTFKAISILDKEYPKVLKTVYKPPYVLFYYGDISLLNKDNTIGVVGSRDVSEYSLRYCKEFLYGLEEVNPVIVSGLASGVDTCGHECAFEYDYPTIAVLGTGIDYCYPKENYRLYEEIKYKGLLISEYPYRDTVDSDSFTFRNRIVAALSKILFIPEIGERSGTSVTLRYALSMGKEILVLPQSCDSKSINNKLIQEGAKMTLSTEDILEELKY